MAGTGYESILAGKEFNFLSFLPNLKEYFEGERSVDLLHDLVNELTGTVQLFVSEIPRVQFSQADAFEALAYSTLAGFFLKEYEQFNDRDFSERRNELAEAWSQLMAILEAKGVDDIIPFPH